MTKALQKQKGFTLIEVIVTIILAALAGVVVFTYLGNVLTKSHIPLEQVKGLAEAVEGMEEIIVEYQEYVKGGRDTADWSAFKSTVSGALVGEGNLYVEAAGLFEIYKVTVTGSNNQKISAIFTQ